MQASIDVKIIGLTGGIGSGKTTVARVFHSMGVPVFDADSEAKALYDTDSKLNEQIKLHFGNDLFENGNLNKRLLAQKVFDDENNLKRLNSIIHPLVKKRFESWLEVQNAKYIIREAAILIESGSYKDCHEIILVTAPEDIRIQRVVDRTGLSPLEIKSRIKRQWTDEQKKVYCQHELVNDEKSLLTPQILALHQYFMA